MKVIMISGDSKIYDQESAVYRRARGYSNHVDELVVIVPVKDGEALIKNDGPLTIIPVRIKSKIGSFFALLKTLKEAVRERKDKCVITSQDPFYYGLISVFVAQKNKIPLEVQVHTDIAELTKGRVILQLIAAYCLKKADKVRVVSQVALNKLKALVPEITQKSYVLPIAVSEKKYEEISFKKTKLSVLVVSRLEEEKNVSRALHVFKKLRERIPDLELRIAGEGSLEHRLRQESVRLGIEAYTVFLGFIEDLSSEYARARVLLHTSNYEGFGLVFVEAAQAGLPIVSTNTGVAREITDYVFDSENIEKAACFCEMLLTDEEAWNKVSGSGKEKSKKFIVSQRTYQKNITDAWKELYQKD